MPNLILTLLVAVLTTIVMQFPIARAARKIQAIAAWRPMLIVFSLIWGVWFVVRVYALADIPGVRQDSVLHDVQSQVVAEYIRAGDIQSALHLSGVGNEGFHFVVG